MTLRAALADRRTASRCRALRLSREPFTFLPSSPSPAELTAAHFGGGRRWGCGALASPAQIASSDAAGAGENAGRAGMSRRKCGNTGNRRRKVCTCDIQIV